MKIALINYEVALGINGILTKYAVKMEEQLKALGHEVGVYSKPQKGVDINHHINYFSYVHEPTTKNSLMVTHITDEMKLYNITKGMETADIGICYSKETEKQLKKEGIKKLTTILPAHDALPRAPIVVAILTNIYPNGCKREGMFIELLKHIDLSQFVFLIMGRGWEPIVKQLEHTGIQAEVHTQFDATNHKRILDLADYCAYFGDDEGAMSILDATYHRIPTIAPNVGFHQEIGITHPFYTQNGLNEIFKAIQRTSVDDWTWERYAKEHEKVWKRLNTVKIK